MTEKLEPQLDQGKIKQTRTFIEPIRFREDAIIRVKNSQYNFNNKSFLFIPFKVSYDDRSVEINVSRYSDNSMISEPQLKSKVSEAIWRLKNKK